MNSVLCQRKHADEWENWNIINCIQLPGIATVISALLACRGTVWSNVFGLLRNRFKLAKLMAFSFAGLEEYRYRCWNIIVFLWKLYISNGAQNQAKTKMCLKWPYAYNPLPVELPFSSLPLSNSFPDPIYSTMVISEGTRSAKTFQNWQHHSSANNALQRVNHAERHISLCILTTDHLRFVS